MDQNTDLKELIAEQDRDAKRELRCAIESVLIGSIIGWAVGMAQILYMGSWDFFAWDYMPLMPLYSGFGGGLYGMIFGGGGFFAKPAHIEVQRPSEKAVGQHAA